MMHSQILFLILFTSAAHAQTPIRIDSLPESGRLLNKGWRWHAGDNPDWASVTLDDSRWDTIKAAPLIKDAPQFQQKQIGWFRIRFVLDSAVAAQPLSMRFWQTGASDIYLDGKLFRKQGEIGPQGQTIRAYSPPTGEYQLLTGLSSGPHVLAIRLTHNPVPWYAPRVVELSSTFLAVRLLLTEGLAGRIAERVFWEDAQNYLFTGIFVALSAIHALYFFFRRRRINAVFAITTLLSALAIVFGSAASLSSNPLATEWFALGRQLAQVLFFIFLLMTYYLYLHQRPTRLFWIVSGVMVVSCLVAYYTPYTFMSWGITGGLVVLFTLGIQLSVVAVKRKSAEGHVILISLGILVALLTVQLIVQLAVSDDVLAQYPYIMKTFDLLFLVSVPFTLAVMLARENAQTNEALSRQLLEVEKLSAEKEQILLEQNATLEQQVAERTAELRQSLEDLRTTQQQLVQREKMASLGELTAGIAHEIQNPLNFVNNFSEVSAELVEEIQDERQKPSGRDEELEGELLADLSQNLEKISHHGKRAASIVRGMLEHSRASTGQREPTNLNALADEYLRLSYHGLRAKDKTFNATLLTDFDPALAPVPIIAQDLGRVFLNLFTNAFYAVGERKQASPSGYEPTVSVCTRTTSGGVEIRVSDNGTGIPDSLRQKIFQPFFTTKPTGQGTGLGLSLSYDIITKGHGGTLSVESEEGQGTTFVIHLPHNV